MKNHSYKKLLSRLFGIGIATFLSLPLISQTFTENGGSLTIQAEDLNLKTNWKKQSSVAGSTGSGYIVWEGSNYFANPGPASNNLSATIKINTPGKYRFTWRSKVGKGDDSKEHNDTWLKFPTASDMYGEKDGTKKWPKGSGKTPNPNGNSADGYLKIFLNKTTDWTETTVTSDFEDYPVFVEFASAGNYEMVLSPRSDFHLIDKIMMNREGGSGNNNNGGYTSPVKPLNNIRVAYSADGNDHDTDDWLASPWSLALLRSSGVDDKLVFFEYNNHVWGTRGSFDEIQNGNITGLVSRWGGFPNTNFYNVETQETAAKNKLRDEINASSASNQLIIIAAGPLETIGRAVEAATASKRQYVTMVSHSDWNNEHANRFHNSKYSLDYIRNLGINYKRVNDMNGDSDDGYTEFGLKRKTAVMENRLKNHPDDRVKWLWTARKMPEYELPSYQKGYYDYSDAGMTWWLITGALNGGDERVTPQKTMELLEFYLGGGNTSCGVTLNGINDFDNLNIGGGLVPAYKDNDRSAIAVNSVEYETEWAGAKTNFTGTSGTYDITLTTLTEIDGESSYRLRVGGNLVGTYKNPESNTDYAPSTKTWTGVSVNDGDVVQVECQAHTNGKIPEGGGTAYARGRWTQVDFKCTSSNNTNNPPTGSFTVPTFSTLEEGYDALYVKVDASDPDTGGSIANVTLKINGVEIRTESGAPYEWGKEGAFPEETLVLVAGDNLLEAIITDDKGAKFTVSKTITLIEKGVSTYSPIHDAYVEGANGKNDDLLRVENGNRVAYLMFDVASLGNQDLVTASLTLTVGEDDGNGTLRVSDANGDWTEGSINANNAPVKGAELDSKIGTFSTGSTYTFDVDGMTVVNGKVTLMLEMDNGGNDVSFASKDQNGIAKPELRIKVNEVVSSTFNSNDVQGIIIFPNPNETGVFNLTSSTEWKVLSVQGQEISNGEGEQIDISHLNKGIYIVQLPHGVAKRVIIK